MARKETPYYRDLSGGLNADAAPDIVKDNELTVAKNASFSKLGAVSKRYGFLPLGYEGTLPAQILDDSPAAYAAMDTDTDSDGVVNGFASSAVQATPVYSLDEDAQKITLADVLTVQGAGAVKHAALFALLPDTQYTVSVETKLVKSVGGTEVIRARVAFYDVEENQIIVPGVDDCDPGESFTTVSATVTSPANTALGFLQFVLKGGAIGATGSAWFKNAKLTRPTTTTEVVLPSTASSGDDAYNGKLLILRSGTGAYQVRTISDYEGARRRAVLSTALTTMPDATSTFIIAASYGKTVNRVIPWLRFDGTETLLAVMTDSLGAVTLNKLDATTYAPTELCSLNKADIGWFWWQDKFYFADGAVFRRYDGTTAIQVAPSKPGTLSVVDGPSSPSGELQSGVHYWLLTFVNEDGVESEASNIAYVNVTATNQATLTIPTASSGQGVTKRKIYRSAAGFDGPLKYLTVVNDNTTTTYVDTISDASLGAEWVAPTRSMTEVNRCNRLVFHPHSQRVFASGDATDPGATYFSDAADPTEWRADWKLYSHAALGLVVSMSVFGDALAVHYEHGHMRWKGTDPASDLTWYQVPVNIGPASPHATCLVPNALGFAAKGGVYLISPAALETDYILQPGESIVSNILKGKATSVLAGAYSLASASAAYDVAHSRYLLAYQADSASGANDSILVIDWTLGAVSVWDGFPVNHLAPNKDGDVLVASDNYVLKLTADDYADWNTATGAEKGIAFCVTTKAFDMGYPLHRKKVSRLYIAAEQAEGSEADVTVTTEGDSETFSATDLSGTESQELYEAKCSLKGDRFSVTIADDTIDAPVSIHGIGFRLKTLTPKGTKVTEVEEA